MTKSELTVLGESMRNVSAGFTAAGDVLRHEGLKRMVEWGLNHASDSEIGRRALEWAAGQQVVDPALAITIGAVELEGPVGIAPGWDKTGKSILGLQTLGAHHVTVGGVPLYSQLGNPMPRLRTFDAKIGDHGKTRSLNSYGFYSPGEEKVRQNIEEQRDTGLVHIPVFVQVTANKEFYEPSRRHELPEIIAKTVQKLVPVADGISFGLSSPNTLGMRDAQAYEFLRNIIVASMEAGSNATARDIPYILKGDGDGGDTRLDTYIRLAEETGVHLELINTTGREEIKAKYGAEHTPGGLAGADPDYQDLAITAIRYVAEAVDGKVDIIGTGGVNNGAQADKMLKAGAKAIGINTAMRELGVKAVRQIERELIELRAT